jgi:hypothetical protein
LVVYAKPATSAGAIVLPLCINHSGNSAHRIGW